MKSNANPMKQSAKLWIVRRLKYLRMKPKPKRGIAAAEMENENPKRETIHAVTVVPMFAPKITPMACVSVKISAFTKLTTMTVVAPEDWMTAVTPIPVRTAASLFPVILPSIF